MINGYQLSALTSLPQVNLFISEKSKILSNNQSKPAGGFLLKFYLTFTVRLREVFAFQHSATPTLHHSTTPFTFSTLFRQFVQNRRCISVTSVLVLQNEDKHLVRVFGRFGLPLNLNNRFDQEVVVLCTGPGQFQNLPGFGQVDR